MWKRLRDSHREALRRRGQAAHNLNPWKYEVLMEFILPQMSTIETREPANSTASQDGCNGHNDTSDANTNDVEPQTVQVSPESAIPATSSSEPDRKQKTPNLVLANAKHQDNRERRREHWQTERGHHRRHMMDSNRDNMASLSSDALSNLFTSLCQKTKLLPRFLQLRVQREVFESVTRAEEEAMSLESLNVCYSPNNETSSYGYTGAYQSSPFADASPSSPEVKPQLSLDNCSSPGDSTEI